MPPTTYHSILNSIHTTSAILNTHMALKRIAWILSLVSADVFAKTDYIKAAIDQGHKRHEQFPALLDQRNASISKPTPGHSGGQWTSETHVVVNGLNIDAGLMVFLEHTCAAYEKNRQVCNCLEFGSGLGMYSAYLKKHFHRHVVAIEPEPIGGVFKTGNSPWQSTVNVFDYGRSEHSSIIKKLGGPFKLIFSIEVMEHVPLEKHADAAAFFYAAASSDGASLVFSAAGPHQKGTEHIGGREADSWREILENAGFVFDASGTVAAQNSVDSINVNQAKNIMVFTRGSHSDGTADSYTAASKADYFKMKAEAIQRQHKNRLRGNVNSG